MNAESNPVPHTQNAAGIVAMLVSQALFVANDALVKLATKSLPATQIIAVRGVMATLLVAAITHRTGALFRHHLYRNPRVLLRSVLEAVVAVLYIIALAHIPLPTIITVLQAAPLILVAAGAFLGEKVDWRRWVAVGIGFVGVLMVVRPTDGGSAYIWLALIGTFVVAARDLITRRIHAEIPSAIVTLMTTACVGLSGFLGAAFQDWQPIGTTTALLLVGSAVLVSGGSYMIIRALRLAEVSVVAPYRYSAIVWAVALGVILWGDVPDAWAFAGTALIVAAGIYTFHRERSRRNPLVPGSSGNP